MNTQLQYNYKKLVVGATYVNQHNYSYYFAGPFLSLVQRYSLIEQIADKFSSSVLVMNIRTSFCDHKLKEWKDYSAQVQAFKCLSCNLRLGLREINS